MFDKLLESVEQVIFQFIVDIILIPHTVYHIYKDSKLCYNDVVHELSQDADKQFKNILSPIKLSVYITILLAIMVKNFGGLSDFIDRFDNIGVFEKFILLFLVININSIVFSVVISLIQKIKINSSEFRIILSSFIYSSSYLTVPFVLLYSTILIFKPNFTLQNYHSELFNGENHILIQIILFITCIALLLLLVVGATKTFKAYRYILQNILIKNEGYQLILTILFFTIQIVHSRIFLI